MHIMVFLRCFSCTIRKISARSARRDQEAGIDRIDAIICIDRGWPQNAVHVDRVVVFAGIDVGAILPHGITMLGEAGTIPFVQGA